MHTQSKPGPVFEQKLCQDILHQNAHGWINIDLGVCGRNLGLRLQPLVVKWLGLVSDISLRVLEVFWPDCRVLWVLCKR